MPALSFWDGTAWVQVGGVADGVHAVGPVAPTTPQLGTVWLDTSAPAQATPLVYGPNGEILLHASGQGSVGRITRTAGPQEDVHLRSGDAVGSYAFMESQNGSFATSNAYWDGTNWMRYDTAQAASGIGATGGVYYFWSAPAGANPITWTLAQLTPAQVAALALPSVARLASYETADLKSNTAYPASTWTDLNGYHYFTVGSATSWQTVEVRFGTLVYGNPTTQVGARLVVNGTLTYPLASGVATTNFGNLAGSLSMRLPPGVLIPGVNANALWIQLFGNTAFNVYCRCGGSPQTEWVHLLVSEHGV